MNTTKTRKQRSVKSINQKIEDKSIVNKACRIWTGAWNGSTPILTHYNRQINARRHLYSSNYKITDLKCKVKNVCGNAACIEPSHQTTTGSLEDYENRCNISDDTGCWTQKNGKVNLRRPIYTEAFGETTSKIRNVCNNPACVSPEHNTDSFSESFWDKCEVNKDGCWYWKGVRQPNGYGRVFYPAKGGIEYSHRVAYMITNNLTSLEKGVCITHSCDNGHKACVNPAHLSASTQTANIKERTNRGRHKGRVLSKVQVKAIRRLEGHMETWEAAEVFNVDPRTIYYDLEEDYSCRQEINPELINYSTKLNDIVTEQQKA